MHRLIIAIFTASILTLASCATAPPRPPAPTIPDVIAMAKSGMPADEIISRMEQSNAVYRLQGSDYARLRQDGVPDKVLDYMKQVEIYDARYREWAASRDNWGYGPGAWPYGSRRPGWWYGPPAPIPPPRPF